MNLWLRSGLSRNAPPLRRWQGRVVLTVFITYATYYFCRQNVAAALPAIGDEFGLSRASLGQITMALFIGYGIGQVFFGLLADRFGARYLLLTGMLVSAGLNVSFALSHPVVPMVVLWGLNGMFQASGMPACAKTIANWFTPAQRGRVQAVRGMDYPVGALLVTLLYPVPPGEALQLVLVAGLPHLLLQEADAPIDPVQTLMAGDHLIQEGPPTGPGGLLQEKAHLGAPVADHLARVRFDVAGENAEKGALPRPVRSDQTDPFLGAHGEVHVGEEGAARKPFLHADECDHEVSLPQEGRRKTAGERSPGLTLIEILRKVKSGPDGNGEPPTARSGEGTIAVRGREARRPFSIHRAARSPRASERSIGRKVPAPTPARAPEP